MTTQTNNVTLTDGLYCLWTEEGVDAARVQNGRVTNATIEELVTVRKYARTLAGCETIDDMPTVPVAEATAICQAYDCDLSPELVAVCRV